MRSKGYFLIVVAVEDRKKSNIFHRAIKRRRAKFSEDFGEERNFKYNKIGFKM